MLRTSFRTVCGVVPELFATKDTPDEVMSNNSGSFNGKIKVETLRSLDPPLNIHERKNNRSNILE